MVRIAAFLLMAALQVSAQEVAFTAKTDKKTVGLSSRFEVSFTISNGDVQQFMPPDLSAFTVLGGPNTSNSMTIVNGTVTRSYTYSYVLQPRQMGKFTIAPAQVKVQGKVLQSNPLSIEVVKDAKGQTSRPDEEINLEENLFLKISASRTNVYEGEQILVTYRIYTRVNIVNYELQKMPANEGFWSYDVNKDNRITLTNEIYNGMEYRVGLINESILFPQRDGELTLEPMEMKVVVRVMDQRRRSLFDDFFGGSYRDVESKLVSNKVVVTSKPLPPGAPQGFVGTVGTFDFSVVPDKTETRTDEPITVKVRIAGKGNIKMISGTVLAFPPSFDMFDPKVSESISMAGNVVSGSKSFDYLVIPRVAGDYRLDPARFSFFDPVKEEYVTLASPEFIFHIEKGASAAQQGAPVTGISKEDIALLGEDILFIKTGPVDFRRKDDPFFGSVPFLALLALPFLLVTTAGIAAGRRRRLAGNSALLKNRRAGKAARRRMAKAASHLKKGERKEFYTEVAHALWGYLADKLTIQVADLTMQKAADILAGKGISEETVGSIRNTIDKCEMALFASSGGAPGMNEVYSEAVRLITELDARLG